MKNLIEKWLEEKRIEQAAQENRRHIEDMISEKLNIDSTLEKTHNLELEGFKLKLTQRFTRKVDADKLQDIAREYELSHLLGDLFRWTPSINAKQWNATEFSIVNTLNKAITTKPSRLSFNIEKIEE